MDINFLDKTLRFLYTCKSGYTFTKDQPPQYSDEEYKFLKPALEKLIKDGYANKVSTQSSATKNFIHTYNISFEGILALSNDGGQPYAEQKKKEYIIKIWNVFKIIAVAVNAIVVLLFTILTFMYKD
ncbi:hypothetical protein OMO38_10400 [Chryseobacterium sp. 09-1422]|uniref:Uncharacterized protein n=1 Tax=Chryseobacterium kimseyorum TaxID=2984028 RepID=A0ABT3HYP8_9FLAO|nr:hypothetical protein [Chryseobacterium kimseyorum]MCW3168932.1 hypothetical protein [Chryseobacterium kimseyorum]